MGLTGRVHDGESAWENVRNLAWCDSTRSARGARTTCSHSSRSGSRTPRSPSDCSSAPRPPSTTLDASSPNWGSAAGPRLPPMRHDEDDYGVYASGRAVRQSLHPTATAYRRTVLPPTRCVADRTEGQSPSAARWSANQHSVRTHFRTASKPYAHRSGRAQSSQSVPGEPLRLAGSGVVAGVISRLAATMFVERSGREPDDPCERRRRFKPQVPPPTPSSTTRGRDSTRTRPSWL